MRSISILLPVVDELENLKVIIPYFCEAYKSDDIEIIVIEDMVEDEQTKDFVQIFEQGIYVQGDNDGLTAAIKKGISLSKKDLIYWSDADLSHPPEMIHSMLTHIERGYDIVSCSRFEKESKDYTHEGSGFIFFHKILSKILSLLGQLFLIHNFKDYSSGFILIKRDVLEQVDFSGDYGEYYMELIYKSYRKGYKVCEIPFISPKRIHGYSKTATNFYQLFSRGYKYLLKIIELRFLRTK